MASYYHELKKKCVEVNNELPDHVASQARSTSEKGKGLVDYVYKPCPRPVGRGKVVAYSVLMIYMCNNPWGDYELWYRIRVDRGNEWYSHAIHQ